MIILLKSVFCYFLAILKSTCLPSIPVYTDEWGGRQDDEECFLVLFLSLMSAFKFYFVLKSYFLA